MTRRASFAYIPASAGEPDALRLQELLPGVALTALPDEAIPSAPAGRPSEQGISTMARRCELTGKGVQAGNNVSHAQNKTRRRFLPNLQTVSLLSDRLGETVRLRLSTRAIRTVEKRGGIDGYVMSVAPTSLPASLRRLRKRLEAAQATA